MEKINDFVTIEDAAKATRKSVSTIRRFVQAHKDIGTDVIREETNEKNRLLYKINKSFILTYYNLGISKKQKEKENKSSGHSKHITGFYLYYKNAYILTKRILIFSLILWIIIAVGFSVFIFNQKKLFTRQYTHKVKYLKKEIAKLNYTIIQNNKRYEQLLHQTKTIEDKYNGMQDDKIKNIDKRIENIEKYFSNKKILDS